MAPDGWSLDSDIPIGTIGCLVEMVVAGTTSWSLHDRPVKR
jgi:hypothetical protein